MHRAHGLNPGRALVKLFVLTLDARAHAGNHTGVLAAQAAQLSQLVIQLSAAHINNSVHLPLQLLHIGMYCGLQHLLALPHDAVGQQVLKRGQAAGLQQDIVAAHLGNQTLLGRNR